MTEPTIHIDPEVEALFHDQESFYYQYHMTVQDLNGYMHMLSEDQIAFATFLFETENLLMDEDLISIYGTAIPLTHFIKTIMNMEA